MCETETEVRPPIDAYAIALDETGHYEIDAADRPYIERIVGVYVFDRSERTHLCELTPSYYLIHLYDEVRLTPLGMDCEDERRLDEIYQKYEYCESQDIYVHCHSVERLLAQAEERPFTVYHYGEPENEDDAEHDEVMEALREELNCNHPF